MEKITRPAGDPYGIPLSGYMERITRKAAKRIAHTGYAARGLRPRAAAVTRYSSVVAFDRSLRRARVLVG